MRVGRHAHRMAGREPSVGAPRREKEHALDGLLAHDRAEERGAGNTLGLLEAFVEGGDERAGPAPDLRRDGQDRVGCPGGSLHEPLIVVVRRVKHGDEDVAAREESISRR